MTDELTLEQRIAARVATAEVAIEAKWRATVAAACESRDAAEAQLARLHAVVDKQSRLLRVGIHLVQSMPVPSGEWPPVAARWRREAEAAAREAAEAARENDND